jgi:glycosidase
MRWFALLLVLGLALAQEKISITFTYDPPSTLEVKSVAVAGSFNNWAELPMEQTESGAWTLTLELPPGPLQYKYRINGEWPRDMCEDPVYGSPGVDIEVLTCADDGQGGRNALRIIQSESEAQAEAPPISLEHSPSPQFVSQVGQQLSIRFKVSRPLESATLEANRSYPMHRQLTLEGAEVWRVLVPANIGEYRFALRTAEGQQDFGPYQLPATVLKALDWVGGRVGYQIFPDRFFNADVANDARALETAQNLFDQTWSGPPPYLSQWSDPPSTYHCCQQYYGGDLAGVLQKLPYLKALGTSLIYFNPIFNSGSAHGYDTHDYMQVALRLGSNAALKSFLQAAHRQGIKVIFDFVPNHTGTGFWAFQDVLQRGPNSPYWNWYYIKRWPFKAGDGSAYTGWANLGSLPKLNTYNPGVQRYLIEVSKYWLGLGFDGIRVDVANEVSAEFIRAWRTQLKRLKPSAYLVGEIWDINPSYLQGDQYDSLMNYPVGREGALAFASGSPLRTGSRVLERLAQIYATYPEAVAAQSFNLIGSHDTARVLSDLGGGNYGQTPSAESLERLKLASAILFALPGVPVYFQGEECGFVGEKGVWPVNELYRAPLDWEGCNPDVLAHYRLLGTLRQEGLASSVFRTHLGQGPLMAFYRGEPGPGEVLAVFNSGQAGGLELPAGAWRDQVEGRVYRGSVPMGAISWRYLERLP